MHITLDPDETKIIGHALDPRFHAEPSRVIESWVSRNKTGDNLAKLAGTMPVSWSSIENRINDGNRLNYAYNNRSRGSAGKWFGVDAGVGELITATHAEWRDSNWAAYRPRVVKIQGSNDNVTWDDLYEETNPAHVRPADGGHFVSLNGQHTYRYFRWLCVTGNNSSYVFLNEFELYNWDGSLEWVRAHPEISSCGPRALRVKNTLGYRATFFISMWIAGE